MNPKLTCRVNRDLESLMKKTLVSVVKGLPPPWKAKERGRRPYDPRTVAVCCMLRVALRHTYESVEAYLRRDQHLKRLMRVKRLPGHSVIHRGMERLSMPYIRKVMRNLVWRLRRAGMNVAVDSTGFSISNRSMWFNIRVRRISSRKECLKLHIAVDVDSGIIHSFTITCLMGADVTEFHRLVEELPDLGTVMADSAYSSYANYGQVVRKGGEPFLRFKAHHTGSTRCPRPWKNSFRKFMADPEGWMATYHQRSIVEAVFSSIKRTWGSTIRSRKYWNQRRELALKVLAYDVRQALYNERARKLGMDLRRKAD